MIQDDIVEAYNNRLVSVGDLKRMTPAQLDRVKQLGSAAENLLKNKDFVLFVRQFQLETNDALVNIAGHTADDNAHRVALGNHLSGIDSFINLLKRQVVLKNRAVNQQNTSADPGTDN